MKNFKLFIGYLGNGATLANSAVYENGDYKTIGHISNAGNIKLYVKPDYIPAEAMQEILKTAETHHKKTESRLERELQTSYGRGRILDEIERYTPYSESDKLYKTLSKDFFEGEPLPLDIESIKQYYFKNF